MANSLRLEYTDYYKKEQAAEVLPAYDDRIITIGRRDGDHQPNINLSWNHSVSREHAHIFYDLGIWYIEQLSDRNKTTVNDDTLVPGVPFELPPQAEISVGGNSKFEPTVITASHGAVDHTPPGEERAVPTVYDLPTDDEGVETHRVEVLARFAEQLSSPDETLLDRLVGEIQTEFPEASAGGIAVYDDLEIRVPACFPRGPSQISFRLARRALRSQQTLRWEKSIATDASKNFTSLNGVNQAIYAPLLRGYSKLGLVYLHTGGLFEEDDPARLQNLCDMLAGHPDFQPETAHLRMPSVFVSYSRKNTEFVRQLVNDVRRQRISVWWDERLRAGKDWEKQLAAAIRQCDSFALVMSQPSLESENVQWEIEQARATGKPIIPLYYDECDPPDDLSHNQHIEVRGGNYVDGVLQLVDEVIAYAMGELEASNDRIDLPPIPADEKVRILFLVANPVDTSQLRLNEEIRQIEIYLRGSKHRERFEYKPVLAVRPDDLRSAMLDYRPHIVHFSGHGSEQGEIVLEDATGNATSASPEALKLLFGALQDNSDPVNNVRLVVLNACYSAIQAESIAEVIGCVIGMTDAVGDAAAIGFSSAFYEALGYGKNAQQAFNIGQAQMAFFNEAEIPQLLARGVNPTQLTFVSPE